jgi:hypothetical protein
MKTMKMALMAGAAIAVSAAAAHADELSEMKAQIEALNARVATMETAPSVPSGYQLLAVSKGEALQVPGMMGSDRDRVTNDRATIITVMPTADAPAGTTISWSGYVRAAVIYAGAEGDAKLKRSELTDAGNYSVYTKLTGSANNDDDWDVKARGQLRVVATTDTAVGEVGVELKMRGDFAGNGVADVYMKTAWGYWAMTPELTLGGGYAGSLGNIGYGYDGACTCYYTDNADVAFNPGDTSQMRLSYASGPFSMAVAIEDAGIYGGYIGDGSSSNGNQLGVAGEIKYSGDMFSGEISAVYRMVDGNDYTAGNVNLTSAVAVGFDSDVDGLWQVGAGLGFNLGDVASLSLAAAIGSGPFTEVNNYTGEITTSLPVNNDWWGISGLASANLSDAVHAEIGVGYKNRQTDGNSWNVDGIAGDELKSSGIDYDTWAVLGGIYYTPVDQLTIGLEAEWYTTNFSTSTKALEDIEGTDVVAGDKLSLDYEQDNWSVDLVSVWRF